MQVQFKSTNRNADTHCCVCGQGFVIFWEWQSRSERAEALFEIQRTLCNHHRDQRGTQAHPQSGFLVSEWNGSIAPSGAEVFGRAQTCAL